MGKHTNYNMPSGEIEYIPLKEVAQKKKIDTLFWIVISLTIIATIIHFKLGY
jgi:hypothetical protein